MMYEWVKAFHIVTVLMWIGGMFAVSVALGGAALLPRESVVFVAYVRKWDQRVTIPAMFAVWVLGVTLAVKGDWFSSPWLMIKISIVVTLSALHGYLSGVMRRSNNNYTLSSPSKMRFAVPFILGAVFAIVVLVVIKPF